MNTRTDMTPSLAPLLRRHRLRLLRQDAGVRLKQYREGFAFILILIPLAPGLLGWPLAMVGMAAADARVAGAVALLLALSALWAFGFRGPIGGAGFRQYLGSLPVRRSTLVRLDMLVLLATDFPLWLALGSALLQGPAPGNGAVEFAVYASRVGLMFVACLAVQILVLRRDRTLGGIVLAALACLGLGPWLPPLVQLPLLAAAVAATVARLAGAGLDAEGDPT